MVEDDAVRRDDIIGDGRPDHADTTLVVVVIIGDDVVVKRSNTLMVMLDLDLLVWPLVLVIVL